VSSGADGGSPYTTMVGATDGTSSDSHTFTWTVLPAPSGSVPLTWTGAGDDVSWSDPGNWNRHTTPTANDDVTIGAGATVQVGGTAAAHSLQSASALQVNGSLTLSAASAITQGALQVNGTLTLAGSATLDVSSTGEVDGTVQLGSGTQLTLHTGTFGFGAASVTGAGLLRITDGATVNVETTPSVQNLSLQPTGQLTGSGTLTITGTLDWTGGTMSGSGVTQVAAGATATLEGTGAKELDSRTFADAGAVTWLAADITGTGGVVDVQAGGDLAAQGTLTCGASMLNVEGTFRTTGPGTTVAVDATVNVSGTVNAAQDGTIAFQGPVQNAGTIGGPGTIVENRNVNNTGTVGGAGTVTVNGNLTNSGTVGAAGSVILNGNTTSSGTVGAAGTVTVNGTLTTTGIIDGAGSVLVNGTMNWTAGTMQGSGNTTIQAGGVLNVSYTTTIAQNGRNLTNQGTVNWTGGQGASRWEVPTGAQRSPQIVNEGTFNISPAANCSAFFLGRGAVFTNRGSIRQTAGTAAVLANFFSFANDGVVEVNVGELHLQNLDGVNTGTFQIAAGASVILEPVDPTVGLQLETDMILDPNRNDTDAYMIRGQGWFIVRQDRCSLTIPPSATVSADNVALETDGTLKGLGTLVANNFRWDGGTMTTGALPPSQSGQGVTEVPPGGTMTITGVDDVTLDNRQVLNRGAVVWGAFGNPSGDIVVRATGSIVNDGGRFDVWNDATIKNDDSQAGPFIVQNNAVFQKHLTEYLGTTTIGIPFQNNRGIVQADGSVTFSGGFSQTQVTSLTVFGFGTYTVSNSFAVSGGTMQLQGGDLSVPPPRGPGGGALPNFTNAVFRGTGSISGSSELYTDGAQLTLTGDLQVRTIYLTNWTQTHLAGFRLSIAVSGSNESNSTLFLENGALSGPMVNRAFIRGPGIYRGTAVAHLDNAGQIIAGDGNQPGQFIVEGDLVEEATGTVTFGLAAGGYDQLVVLGHAVLAGTIQVSLLNGFSPDPATPDVFQVVTFYSYEGAFETTSIDLGNGLFLDVDADPTDVRLVTRQ
jgi:hypothetical protein